MITNAGLLPFMRIEIGSGVGSDPLTDVSDISFDATASLQHRISNPDLIESIGELKNEESEEIPDWSPQRNFFAESPYFDAFIEKEMHSLEVLTSTLENISERTTEFRNAGSLLAKATIGLSLACCLGSSGNSSDEYQDSDYHLKRKALGPELADALQRVGEVMGEIAKTQENLCTFVEAALGTALKDAAHSEFKLANKMKEESDRQTEKAEHLFFSYLNGDDAATNFPVKSPNDFTSYDGPNSKGFASFLRGFSSQKGASNSVLEEINNHNISRHNKAVKLANWKCIMKQIQHEQTNAELKRFQLAKYLTDARCRRILELSQNVAKFYSEIQSTYDMCSGMLTALRSCVDKSEEACRQLQCEHEKKNKPLWEERENSILETMITMKQAAMDARNDLPSIEKANPAWITPELVNLDDTENEVGLWDFPAQLSKLARHLRSQSSNVICEGWLYQKKIGSNTSQATWDRGWFILEYNALYSLDIASSSDLKENRVANTSKRKVCDVRGWAAQELPDERTARFCFELNHDLHKNITLQARGPKELQMWVESFRSATTKSKYMTADDLDMSLGGLSKYCSSIKFAELEEGNAIPSEREKDTNPNHSQTAPMTNASTQSREKRNILRIESVRSLTRVDSSNHDADKRLSSESEKGKKDVENVGLKFDPKKINSLKSEANENKSNKLPDPINHAIESNPETGNTADKDAGGDKKDELSACTSNKTPNRLNEKSSDDAGSSNSETSPKSDKTVASEKSALKRAGKQLKPNFRTTFDDIKDANQTCADCGSSYPGWACLNLGILICQECKVVHQSLKHASKIRLFTDDSLTNTEKSLLHALGNDRVKKIWERGFKPGSSKKPAGYLADRKTREDWIKSKYERKEFLCINYVDGKTKEKLSKELYDAAVESNIIGIARAFVSGGDINWKNKCDDKKTALQISTSQLKDGDENAIACTEFLVQNGAKVDPVSLQYLSVND